MESAKSILLFLRRNDVRIVPGIVRFSSAIFLLIFSKPNPFLIQSQQTLEAESLLDFSVVTTGFMGASSIKGHQHREMLETVRFENGFHGGIRVDTHSIY